MIGQRRLEPAWPSLRRDWAGSAVIAPGSRRISLLSTRHFLVSAVESATGDLTDSAGGRCPHCESPYFQGFRKKNPGAASPPSTAYASNL